MATEDDPSREGSTHDHSLSPTCFGYGCPAPLVPPYGGSVLRGAVAASVGCSGTAIIGRSVGDSVGAYRTNQDGGGTARCVAASVGDRGAQYHQRRAWDTHLVARHTPDQYCGC
eukprot:1134987-Rhodomonas_salina.2